MNLYRILLLLSLLLFCWVNNAYSRIQHTYYVSNVGNDKNPGTKELPFASIEKARESVRGINKKMTGDIVVYIREGIYKLVSTLNLSSDDSGFNGHNVQYKAYRDEKPIISGGNQISNWVLFDSVRHIYKAKVDTFCNSRQLYVNGVRAIRARSKDAFGWSENGDGYDCPNYVKTWKNISNVEVVSFDEWKCHRGHIVSYKNNHAIMSQPYWRYIHYQYNAPPVWIENALELLDSYGEWYLDRDKGELYYMPRKGEDLDNSVVILPKLETLISASNVSNVQFVGIAFSYATWLFPNSNHGFPCTQADLYDPWQVVTENRQMTGNVRFEKCCNVLIENCHFSHLGSTGLQFFTGCQRNSIRNSVFEDISGSAISIGNLRNWKVSEKDEVADNVIKNNLIKKVAVEYKGCVGILVGYATRTTITHNEIRNLPYTGISLGWGYDSCVVSGRNNEISYNLIDSVMLELRDGGGIYTLSSQPGTRVHHNFLNYQFNTSGSLYPDVGSSHIVFDHNVIMNTTKWIHLWHPKSENDLVENNYIDTKNETLRGTSCIYQSNVYVLNGNWPRKAKSIIRKAGRLAVAKDRLK